MRPSEDENSTDMPTFGKSERLCNVADISRLFTSGFTISKYPLKLKWLPVNLSNNQQIKVVITVSKHKFKKSTDRNRIKRLLREGYRLNKVVLAEGLKGRKCHIAIIFTGTEIPEFKKIESILIELFCRLINEYEKITG